MPKNQQFSKLLAEWNRNLNKREMPWKGIKDPYRIWLSEIILQQTRVEQGEKYYNLLTSIYPTISRLALAQDEDVYRHWQGLGYYNRCKNMLETARFIHTHLQGKFPNSYHEIRSLKGIGDYTAAAIASFAYGLPYAVVDGNVIRVLSRVFGISENFYTAKGKKYYQELAHTLLDIKQPATYNQAMMDLGATVCTPQKPNCILCPFIQICVAKTKKEIEQYPIKKVKLNIKVRYFHFFVFETNEHIYIKQRTEKDVWQKLYSFHTIESDSEKTDNFNKISNNKIKNSLFELEQKLTHQKIKGFFYVYQNISEEDLLQFDLLKIEKKAIKDYAFPRIIISFFEKNNYL